MTNEKRTAFNCLPHSHSLALTLTRILRQLLPNAWTLNIQPVSSVEFHHHEHGNSAQNFNGVSNFVEAVGGDGTSTSASDGLPGIFAQGRIGLYHDWCFMFPMYPRAFDLIHVRGMALPHESCLPQSVLELDRLLRPGGYIVFSGDAPEGLAGSVTEAAVAVLGWQRVAAGEGELDGGQGPVLVMRKLGGTFTTV